MEIHAMQPTTKPGNQKSGAVSALGNPQSFDSLMCSPWSCTIPVFENLQKIYREHARSPKFDIKGFEKRTGMSLATHRPPYLIDSRGVAVIYVVGLIAPKANLLTRVCGAISTQWVASQIGAAITDPGVRAIVLAFDSSGGSAIGLPELAQVVFNAARIKPVVAYSDALMLAAAYWIGSAANAVYISGPAVQVGGIGSVATSRYDPTCSVGKIDIVTGRYRHIAPHRASCNADGDVYQQDEANRIYSVFVGAVAAYRGVPSDVVNQSMAEGQIFVGQKSISAGLADEMMPLSSLVATMASNPAAFANRRRLAAHRVKAPGVVVPAKKQEINVVKTIKVLDLAT